MGGGVDLGEAELPVKLLLVAPGFGRFGVELLVDGLEGRGEFFGAAVLGGDPNSSPAAGEADTLAGTLSRARLAKAAPEGSGRGGRRRRVHHVGSERRDGDDDNGKVTKLTQNAKFARSFKRALTND
jgi:hypothetical protein